MRESVGVVEQCFRRSADLFAPLNRDSRANRARRAVVRD
jgi:hypothetical protein